MKDISLKTSYLISTVVDQRRLNNFLKLKTSYLISTVVDQRRFNQFLKLKTSYLISTVVDEIFKSSCFFSKLVI